MKNPPPDEEGEGASVRYAWQSTWSNCALVEQPGEAALLAVPPGAAVPRVGCEKRDDRCGLGEHHLLHRRRDLAPARRFLKRRGGAGAVAHVGDGDLHRIFVNLDVVVAEDLGA